MTRFFKYLGGILLFILLIMWVGTKLFPVNLGRYQDTSTLIEANNKPLHIFYTQDDKWRVLTNTNEISPLYIKTLIAREDRLFNYHRGINPFSLARALYQWGKNGRIISGGSTLTMQTARLLEPRKRHMSSKLIECFRALQLEWHFSKNDILTIYLTLAPFGGNIEGVNAASWAYFKKHPKNLTISEVALLVAMVQSPSRLRPDKFPTQALKARNIILQLMVKKGFITESIATLSNLTPLPRTVLKPPRHIPHLAFYLKNQFPNKKRITTTISLDLQNQVEKLLQQFDPFLPKKANAAILIVDHQKNKPLVYIGSRNFLDKDHHGFVDYVHAYRSPGSTLKSFIYGLAFDLGIVNPGSYIMDNHCRFGAYAPHNFDKDLHGMVNIKEALMTSLNIPAVTLLNQIGVIRFLGILKGAGVHPQFPKGFEGPSLPIALGGLGMTLEQLVQLYAALAKDGQSQAISYIAKNNTTSYQLLSKRAANQVTDILTRRLSDGHKIAFKTGTSFGHRDAIVIGYDKQYVIGIWTGSHDGSPLGTITGSQITPLLQKIFKILPYDRHYPPILKEPSLCQLQDLTKPLLLQETLNSPFLIFPVTETIIEFDQDKQNFSLPLTVSGGKRPYTWIVDGEPIATQCWQRKYFWTARKSGYYTITVLDAQGKSARANIEIR